jgi:probable poly-beta-1,6-N-acetyl-D-glucosamine export protein
MYFLAGRMILAYWYVPFIMLVFILSPLFIRYTRLKIKIQVLLLIIMMAAAALIWRPIRSLNPLQSLIYFLPHYCIGILCSQHRNAVYTTLQRRELFLLIPVLFLALVQALYTSTVGNPHKNFFAFGIPDISLFQKGFLSLFFMVFLHRFEEKSLKVLVFLASASFAIYFLHPHFINEFGSLFKMTAYVIPPQFLWIPCSISITALSAAIAFCIKYMFPTRSRMIIGW